LGAAISYLLKYWDRLTLFLRQPGAPLDNNVCETWIRREERDFRAEAVSIWRPG